MAQSDGIGSILKIGILGVGAWWLYNTFMAPAAPAAAAATVPPAGTTSPTTAGTSPTTTPAQTTPAAAVTPAGAGGAGNSTATAVTGTAGGAGSLGPLLQTAAGANVTSLNADQWSYYYGTLPGRTAIPPATFNGIFFPSGRPADSATYPVYTAGAFASALAGAGLSGLGAQLASTPVAKPNAVLTAVGVVRQLSGAAGVGPNTAVHPALWAAAWRNAHSAPIDPATLARVFPAGTPVTAGQFVAQLIVQRKRGVSGLGAVPLLLPRLYRRGYGLPVARYGAF